MWRGELVPKISGLSVGSGDMPASRFDTSTTASFVTAPSVQSSSSPRRPQVVLSPRPSLPPLATRTQSSLDIPTRPSGSPLSELINGLKRHGTLHGTGESSNSDAETMAHYDNRPTIAAGPLPPVRFPTSSTTHHGTSSRRSYEHDLELPPSPSPSSGQKRRNTFGGGEAGAEQAWRGEDMSLSTSPRYGRAATASDSAARSPASGAAVALGSAMVGDLTVSEIEGHLEAVEAALHANSLNGGFDPDSLRRHMTSPERRRAVRLSMVANDGSYAEVPPPTSNAGEGNRVTLPPSSQAAIAAAVKQVRRALSSTQLQRNAQQPEFLEDNEPLPFEDQHESFARSPEHVARRDVTPMRAARIRQESMRDVELAYERMRELVQSAAAIAISPQRSPPSSRRRNALAAARHRAAASPDGRRERARSVASLPPSNSFGPEGLLLRSAVRGSKGHNRAQSALTVPPSSSLSGLMGMPSEREEESFRGRGAHASPRRAASSSPVKRNRLDEEQQAKSKVEAPQHSAQKRISVDASRSAGSGSAGDHTSPSTVAKTQGTPRSPHSDANEVVDESWDADRSPSLQTRSHHEKQPQQQHRRNAAGLSPVLGPSMERSPPSEVRPLALASAESARTIEDQRRRARAHLSATSTRAFQQRTPTPTLAAYRAHGDTSSTRDWASTRPSSSGDTRYASAQTSSKYLRRRSGPPEEQRSLEIEGRASSTASPTPQSVVALQRRHHLEKDSLLDSLARTQREIGDLRTANQELESDLRQEVTRTLQLERELVRRDEREADVGQRLARLEAQLAAERSERMLLAEQLAGLLGHADGHGGSLDESSIGVARGVDSARSSRNLHPVLGALISHSGSGSGSGSHGHLLSHNPPESPSLHSYPSVLGLQLGAGEADWENLMDEEPPPLTRQSSPMTLRTRADQSDTSLDSGLGDEADDDEDAQPAHVSRETAGGISRRSPHRSGTPSLLPIPTSSASNSISTAGGGMSSIVRRFPASLAINLANASGDRKISNATTGTTGGDSSFTAQTDSPVGSFIEAFGHHHGYYDPRRPQGYDPLAMDTKTEAALLESLDDAEPTPVASRFEHL